MENKQMVATHSRAAVRARFAFAALLALSFLFVQSLQTVAHANPKKEKRASFGRLKIHTTTGTYPLLIKGAASNKTPFETPATETTQTFERLYDLPPGRYTVQITFSERKIWLREFDIEAGLIHCIGLGYTEAPPEPVVEYCKPFGQVNVSAQPEYTVGEPVTFTATVANYSGDVEPIYTWTISAGTIMRGQGTSEIEVDTAGVAGATNITATVAVDEGSGKPLPPGSTLTCHASANATTIPKPINRFYFKAFDDVKARLDDFVIEAQSIPHSMAYIIYYSGNKCPAGQRSSLGERSVEYMRDSRKFDPSRIKLIDGGKSEMDWVELAVVPLGSPAPQPHPNDLPPLTNDVPADLKSYPCVKDPLDGPRLDRPRFDRRRH
jgi:hypothetical protein